MTAVLSLRPNDVAECQYARFGRVGPITDANHRSHVVYASASAHVIGIWVSVRYCITACAGAPDSAWYWVTNPSFAPAFHCRCDASQPCGGSNTHSSSIVGSNGAIAAPFMS